VSNLTSADSLLASTAATRSEFTGTIETINFLDYSLYDGYFADNAHFPLTSAMEDQPLQLTIDGAYTLTALHSLPLGVATEADALLWETGGNAPWLGEQDVAAFDGVDLAGSGPVTNNQSSVLQATVQGPGTLSFRWRVSSQPGDTLAVALDGVTQTSIFGETVWAQRNVTVPAGVHRVSWTYAKDSSGSAGSDRGFVDQVTFGP
jgi:hypothetical protein